jgi:hypothetical protein
VPGHEALGKILRAFELGGRLARAEDAQATGAKHIDDAGGKGASGPTTVACTFSFAAQSASASMSVSARFSSSCSRAVPALPGAT